MRHITILLFSMLVVQTAKGQIDTDYSGVCHKIQFENRDSVLIDSLIKPIYRPGGFQIIENGVYDFMIDGKAYYQSLLLSIDEAGFWISRNWDYVDENQIIKDSLYFNIEKDIKILLTTTHNGINGSPLKLDRKRFNIRIIESNNNCRVQNLVMTTETGTVYGHYYFTLYGWKKLKMEKGKLYLCEQTGDYLIGR